MTILFLFIYFVSPKLYVTKLNILIKRCAIYQIEQCGLSYFVFRFALQVFLDTNQTFSEKILFRGRIDLYFRQTEGKMRGSQQALSGPGESRVIYLLPWVGETKESIPDSLWKQLYAFQGEWIFFFITETECETTDGKMRIIFVDISLVG